LVAAQASTGSGAQILFSGLPGVAPTTDNLTVDLASGAGPEAYDAGGTNTLNWDGGVVDTVHGGAGNDDITGDASANTLYAGTGADTVYGGDGEDLIFVVDKFTGDTVHCGPGEDRVAYDVLYLTNATYSDVVYPDCEYLIPRHSH
jgi:Ca2+-binding RTX toxin-like protein